MLNRKREENQQSKDDLLFFFKDHVEYKNRFRTLKIRLLDGNIRTILADDSLIVAQLMVYICTQFGIANYDEYSLVYDLESSDSHSTKTATLRRVKFFSRQ